MQYAMPPAVKAELIRLEQRALTLWAVYTLGVLWAHNAGHQPNQFTATS